MVKKLIFYYKKWGFKKSVKNILYRITTCERKRCYGKNNPNSTIYVIRSINDKSPFYTGPIHNLLANYFYVLSHIKYANSKGWIPVVDQLNYPVYNSEEKEVCGTKNAWEYFWHQPGTVTLDMAYKSEKVVLSKQSWFMQWNMGYDAKNYYDKEQISMYCELAKQVPLNEKMEKYVVAKRQEYFSTKGKVMGVSIRYGEHSPKSNYHGPGHPISPETDELIEIVKDRFRIWNMDYIFLASDEQNAIEKFKKEFGNRLIFLPRIRCIESYIYDKENPNPMYLKSSIHQTSLDYLTEMELLSQCDSLIGSITSGLRYALIRNEMKYEHFEIIERGCFPDK